ncbi:hypothetical protein Q0F98_14660 [Paenibacillus amylolyticus]|nr:hypothetical protein Q0F98_14660 [Paenibacillus amylolyticus]
MFVLIAIAVGMFIHSGMKLERFSYMEKGFQLPYTLKMSIQHSRESFALTYRIAIITGVCLCILSPVFIFAASSINDNYASYGVSAFMVMAGVGAFLFVYYGNIQGAYTNLLEKHQLTVDKKQEVKVVRAVEGLYGRWRQLSSCSQALYINGGISIGPYSRLQAFSPGALAMCTIL